MSRELKGYHVALIFGSCFAIIITVNLVLATQAIRTFPGLEVKNSYVASQSFDHDRAAQDALGWQVSVTVKDGVLRLGIGDRSGPVKARIIEAKLGRSTFAGDDRMLEMQQGNGVYVAEVPGLAPGAWRFWLTAEAGDGTLFKQSHDLWVPK
ncbi:FixH family protein [uncultured Paracoccus sp.]|uniref:FixH family protein n=1 Tax=uncultured Paracoccus sp. TaxID=189685 RepID=UPI0026095269|nr:FixH family protein [uncultured Paracoccus sp.]